MVFKQNTSLKYKYKDNYRAVFKYQNNHLLFIQSNKMESSHCCRATMSKESDTHLYVLGAWVLHHRPTAPMSQVAFQYGSIHCSDKVGHIATLFDLN